MAEDVPVECRAGILHVETGRGAQATMLLLTRSLIQPWVIRAGEMMHCDVSMALGVGSCHGWEVPRVGVTDLDVVLPQHLEVYQCRWQRLMRHSCEMILLTPALLYSSHFLCYFGYSCLA